MALLAQCNNSLQSRRCEWTVVKRSLIVQQMTRFKLTRPRCAVSQRQLGFLPGDDVASYRQSSISCTLWPTSPHMDSTGRGLYVPMWLCLFASTLLLRLISERSVVISLIPVHCTIRLNNCKSNLKRISS